MLIVALVLALIGLAALVFAVVTSNELVAWMCIGASVLGVVLLIIDALRERRQRSADGEDQGSEDEGDKGEEPAADDEGDHVDRPEDAGDERPATTDGAGAAESDTPESSGDFGSEAAVPADGRGDGSTQ